MYIIAARNEQVCFSQYTVNCSDHSHTINKRSKGTSFTEKVESNNALITQ